MALFGKKKEKINNAQPSETASKIMELISCPSELLIGANYTDDDIFEIYKNALAEGRKSGFTPLIIIVSEYMLEFLLMNKQSRDKKEMDSKAAREAIIEKSKSIDIAKLIKERYEYAVFMDDENFSEDAIVGEITNGNQLNKFISVNDFMTRALHTELILAKVPDTDSCNLPAWIPMGGFNECPMPEQQVAFFRYWNKTFSVHPAVVGYDTWECYAENPPRNNNVALGLAKEQMAFCSDIVYQGMQTIGALADSLRDASVWYFWWD